LKEEATAFVAGLNTVNVRSDTENADYQSSLQKATYEIHRQTRMPGLVALSRRGMWVTHSYAVSASL
jgi:hypothetical protein